MWKPVSGILALSLACGAGAAHGQSVPEQVVMLVNAARWDNGQLPPLKHDAQLDASSQLHSNNMATRNFFMHCDPDTGTLPWDRMSAAGYAWNGAAENIAVGQATAAQVMASWMNSSGHRANILSGNREIGVGYVFQANDQNNVRTSAGDCTASGTMSGYGHYWTQNFGVRNAVYPLVIAREDVSTTTCGIDLYVYGAGFASQMRFSNDGSTWSAWEPYAANTLWTLRGNSGAMVTVFGQVRNAGGTVRSAQDTIRLATACGTAVPADVLFADGFD